MILWLIGLYETTDDLNFKFPGENEIARLLGVFMRDQKFFPAFVIKFNTSIIHLRPRKTRVTATVEANAVCVFEFAHTSLKIKLSHCSFKLKLVNNTISMESLEGL